MGTRGQSLAGFSLRRQPVEGRRLPLGEEVTGAEKLRPDPCLSHVTCFKDPEVLRIDSAMRPSSTPARPTLRRSAEGRVTYVRQ